MILPDAGRVVWKSAPDGAGAMGANTSSPCVAAGRVFYGTTAGTFHVLDAATGRVVRTLRLGSPVVSILMLLFVGTTAHQMWLGMQVIIEDYVHHELAKFAATCGLHLPEFRGEFEYLVKDEPPKLDLEKDAAAARAEDGAHQH